MTPCRGSATSLAYEHRIYGRSVGTMSKNLRAGLGVLLILMGVVWTLQGLGYVAGSVMTGVTFWAIIGPIVAILGVLAVVRAVRPRHKR